MVIPIGRVCLGSLNMPRVAPALKDTTTQVFFVHYASYLLSSYRSASGLRSVSNKILSFVEYLGVCVVLEVHQLEFLQLGRNVPGTCASSAVLLKYAIYLCFLLLHGKVHAEALWARLQPKLP